MKKCIFLLGVIGATFFTRVAFGQEQEGVITYEIRINVHRTLPPDQEGRKAMIPEFRTFKEQLFFSAGESLCKPLIEDEEDDDASGGGRPRRRFQPRTQIYCNQWSGKVVTLQELSGKNYLIYDSVKVAPWKLGTDLKTVQGYVCKQAFYTDEERKQTITAWYSDKLRSFLGPDRYSTLPGAVLAIDINNGERVIAATKIEIRALKKDELKEPTNGQKITEPEFRKLMQEQMRNRGRGGMYRN
jgi:GLPGLI family protein